jgi:NitT/TauT family transport system permease protein/taurine transport system permease protein/sulfonate transport system permease protein
MTVTKPHVVRRRFIALYPVLPIVGIIAWYSSTSADDFSAPSPEGVLEAATQLIEDGRLADGLAISFGRVATGFALALALGTVVGMLMGRVRPVRLVMDPLIEMVRPIAPIALVPLAILWLGTGDPSAVSIITYAAFFPVVLNVYSATTHLDQSLINAARTFGVRNGVIFGHVLLPGIVPGVITGARLGMGLAWTAVIAAELAVVQTDPTEAPGIGQLMLIFYQYEANPNPIVVCMVAIGLLGIALDAIIRGIGKITTPWLTERGG